jgi:hypothetical protein
MVEDTMLANEQHYFAKCIESSTVAQSLIERDRGNLDCRIFLTGEIDGESGLWNI